MKKPGAIAIAFAAMLGGLALPVALHSQASSSQASPNQASATGALADLRAAVAAIDAKRDAAAIASLKALAQKLPKLGDYVAWFLASAQFDSEDYEDVPKTLERVFNQNLPSPLVSRSVFLAVRALEQTGQPEQAVALLRKYRDRLPQPQGDFALASAYAITGDSANAVLYNQRVYYGFPVSAEAAQAEPLLAKMRNQLGDQYPPAPANLILGRETKLLDSGQAEQARKELLNVIPELAGADRDLARVKVGEADYQRRETLAAHRYLAELTLDSPEADAERLYYLLLCGRRSNNRDSMNESLDRLARLYPASPWRLEALLAAAGSYLVENQPDLYEPLYGACFESFSKDPRAAECQWKVAWGHYLRREPDAAELLRAHLRLFPASDQASAAEYFLGRLAESDGDLPAAKAYYAEVVREYPNYYYAALAKDRLQPKDRLEKGAVTNAVASQATLGFLKSVSFPIRARVRSFEPNPTTALRLERARLLAAADLTDWAEGELRYAAQNEDQPHVIALELAAQASRRDAPDQAMRYLKRYAPDYLSLPVDSAPAQFWQLAFPLPYRADLEKYAKQNGLDPFLVAALVRQESEFNPKAISRANARGLTQILPSTGRELSRRLNLKPYNTARLFQPEINLALGAYYLKTVADKLGGRWEAALAAYNAGMSRANAWSGWAEFREPAEFIETVPFRETRNYIQIVLRNAEMYRRLYASLPEAPKLAKAEPVASVSPTQYKKKKNAVTSR